MQVADGPRRRPCVATSTDRATAASSQVLGSGTVTNEAKLLAGAKVSPTYSLPIPARLRIFWSLNIR
jgi:hypothetical protein